MKNRKQRVLAGVLALGLPAMSFAADLYLDYNGTAAGFGTTGTLVVDPTATTWNTDSTGGAGGTIGTVSSGDVLHFGLEGSSGILFNWANYGGVSVGGIHTYQTTGSTAWINRMQKAGGGLLQLNLSPGAVINTEQANSFWWDFSTAGDFTKTGSQWLILADGGAKINGTATISQGNLIVRQTGTVNANSSVVLAGGELRFDDNIDDAGATIVNMGTIGGSGQVTRDGTANAINNLTINTMGAAMGNADATDQIDFSWGAAAAFVAGASSTMEINKSGTTLDSDKVLIGWGGRALTLGGDLTVDLLAGSDALANGDTFDLFSDNLIGGFGSITINASLGSGLSWDTSELAAGGDGTLTVIPEPATIGMVVVFGGGMIWIRRKFMI
jgi:hypothetical protein